ncbi:tetratricopeptide repeat protein [Nonomuraea turkmeniaca]|uniref:Tetratricopeptide repeat protein n=1 Tax=Nonomuraea turkmeniaca TaxID=103838 RepID=A0A5S4FNG9_9ACTN|nr:BTAD domain-containing putative transcriptional regulator [Nonomuraea turkmeniaca]TMR22215.1 tetratricopeptide repeat protein [Nonomuraea turkmeniaca]
MEFRILGSVELWADGEACELGSAKERHVLAVLLLTPGQPVSIETMINRVWDDAPPSKARESVHSYIARLRSRLNRRLDSTGARLSSRSGAYVLETDPQTIDLHRFRRLNAQARAISDSGDPEDALRLLREAESLWRGDPLSGLSGEWVTKLRTSLESEHRAAIGMRLAMELDMGRHAELVGELYGLVHQYPYDESFVEHLMIVLYRCGRQGEALEAYHQASHRLVKDLGAEPGPVLRGTYERILRGDSDLATPPAHHHVAAEPLTDNLPRDIPDFTGREAEMSHLYDELERSPSTAMIKAIDGMAGVGKTALAVHMAHELADRYPDGRWYLHLRAHDPHQPPIEPAQGLEVLLRLLGEDPQRIPEALEQRAALWRARLANRQMLIVLDDAASADQVRPFLPGRPGSLVLITSRRRLAGLEGVRPLSLDALMPPEAALLFRRIVGQERRLDAGDVKQLVHLCGHLPLAVTIMANKLRHRPARGVGDLVVKLSRPKGQLVEMYAGDSDLLTAFDLSYQELSSERRKAFRRLGLHVGADLTIGAAAALIGCDPTQAEHALEELIDRHLVEEPNSGRVCFHDLLRAYARERATEEEPAEEPQRAVRRLLDFYLYAADRADRVLYPHRRRDNVSVSHPPDSPSVDSPRSAAEWLRAERVNVLMCVHYSAEHAYPVHAIQLSQAIATYLERSAHWEDAARVHELARRACQEIGDRGGEARVELELSLVRSRTGHYAEAFERAGKGLSIFRMLGDRRGEADTLDHLARLSWLSGHNREALGYAEKALALFCAIADRHGEGNALLHSGIALSYLGRAEEAMGVFETSLEISNETGDIATKAMVLNNLGELHFNHGDYRNALALFREALVILREAGWRQNEAVALNNIANCLEREGRRAEALVFYREALTIYRETGDRRHEADTLSNIGSTYLGMDLNAEALIHFQKALSIARDIGDPYESSRALQRIGDSQRHSGQFTLARETYEQALTLARELGDPFLEASSLLGLGEALLCMHGRKIAERSWRQALTIFERLGAPEAESVRERLDIPRTAGA